MGKTLYVGLILIFLIMITGCSKAGDVEENNGFEENQTDALDNIIEETSAETQTSDVTSLETTSQSEFDKSLEITEHDTRVPNVVVADHYKDPIARKILEGFFHQEGLTYLFADYHSNLLTAAEMQKVPEDREYRADIITYFDGSGDGLLYTRPYKHSGDIQGDGEKSIVTLYGFALPLEQSQLRDRLDDYLSFLVTSGNYEALINDQTHPKYATLLYSEEVWNAKWEGQLFPTTYEDVYDHTVRVKIDGKTFSLASSLSTYASMLVDNYGNYYHGGSPDKLAKMIAISNNEYSVEEEASGTRKLRIGHDVTNNYFEWYNVNYGSNQSYFNITFSNGEKKYKSTSKPGEEQGFVTINGKTYIPLDVFFTTLGIKCKIEYDEQENLVYFVY
ncbi:hypothetical protein LCL95_17910 [Bacillus timonensis]|nr:hypothetical protein [Bacillus timonensis]